MAAQHVQVGHTATIEARFYADGVLQDDGTPTIGITRADGTTLVAPGTATSSGGTGIRQYALPAQPEVNLLKATWTGATQTVITWVEIVGDILYTLAAMRAVKTAGGTPFAVTADYPNQMLLDRRSEVTDDFEAKTGWSFIPRFTREEHSGDGTSTLIINEYKPGKLLSVTVDGTAQTLADFDLTPDGVLTWHGGRFPATRPGNVTIEYVRGWDRPPAKISSDALAVAASWLLPPQASNASTWTTPDGTSYSFDNAGRALSGGGTAFYGIPKVDADLNNPAYNASGAGGFS
jgi:hypothetical protein